MSDPVEALGKRLRDALGEGSPLEARLAQREHFIRLSQTLEGRGIRSRPLRPWLAVATAALGLCLVAFGVRSYHVKRHRFYAVVESGDGATRISAGDRLRTNVDQLLALDFSDESRVELQANTAAEVAQVGQEAVRVQLTGGQLQVSVQPVQPRRWQFECGPFRVTVLGTRFSLDWDPREGELHVAVEKGRVSVAGPGLLRDIEVTDRERLDIDTLGRYRVTHRPPLQVTSRPATLPEKNSSAAALDDKKEAARPAPPTSAFDEGEETARYAPSTSTPNEEEETARPARTRSERVRKRKMRRTAGPRASAPQRQSSARPVVQPAIPPSWEKLAAQGRYREAWAKAKSEGLSSLENLASAEELVRLADIARFANDVDASLRLLEKARGGTGPARERATFRLGRVLLDQAGRHQSAAKWFTTYLREYPDGRWSERASSLRIESLLRAGRAREASEAGRGYLERFPQGPSRAQARQALQREQPSRSGDRGPK